MKEVARSLCATHTQYKGNDEKGKYPRESFDSIRLGISFDI